MSLRTPELRTLLKAFVEAAHQCAGPDVKTLKFERFRLHGGMMFEVSDEVIDTQENFIRVAVKGLGPVKGHAKVLDKSLWDFATSIENVSSLESNSVLNDALEKIETQSASVCEFFRPCPLVKLPDGTDRIDIGRVSINRAEARLADFRKLNPKFKFGVGKDWSLSILMASEEVGVITNLPPIMWAVNLAAADPIREQEALWLVDVALSLLRMSVNRDDLGALAPTVGYVEPNPFLLHDSRDHSFTLRQEGGGTLGGMTAARDYQLTSDGIEKLEQASVQDRFATVFEARPKSLAERFYQCCGWLTRGRRSLDKSDRLLYFFTAIEALLTDSDKTAPVVQTISRHAAVLLSDDNEKRRNIAKDVKQLYVVRSALVHAGRRGAFDIDSNSAQQLAELLYLRVWNDFDLTQRHQDFSGALSRASFGLPLEAPPSE